MACNQCDESIFIQKLGRCFRCMAQLTSLSVIGWPLWWWFYAEQPTKVESIGLLFFCSAFSALLLLHLLFLAYYEIKKRIT
ncbi:DUF3624 domain-containing protein [Shewanella sp. HL-SH8]|uniref:DUF3624 domain-containing protein n=1 Tax=Shewanella sp. HL-SH8 TaxID=3436242 RepID=UPI003EB8E3F4